MSKVQRRETIPEYKTQFIPSFTWNMCKLPSGDSAMGKKLLFSAFRFII